MVSVEFADEYAAGLPSAGAFALRSSFDAQLSALVLAVFVGPQLLGLTLEPLLLLWAERFPRARMLALGLSGMGISLGVGACGGDLLTFGIAFALYGPFSGVACGLAQATLMESDPGHREQRMAEWTLAGYLGDLGTPLFLWAFAGFDLGWRAAFAVTAGCLLVFATGALWFPGLFAGEVNSVASGSRASVETDIEVTEEPTLRGALRVVAGNRALLAWLTAAALCGLLDEPLAFLLGLRVHGDTAESARVFQSLTAWTVGGSVGLLVLRPALRRVDSTRLLVVGCLGSALGYVAWLLVEGSVQGVLAIAWTGFFTALHYPLTQARAYAALPRRATLVAAAAQAFSVFDLVLPLAIGVLADHLGVWVALLTLLLQPVGILMMVSWTTRGRVTGRGK